MELEREVMEAYEIYRNVLQTVCTISLLVMFGGLGLGVILYHVWEPLKRMFGGVRGVGGALAVVFVVGMVMYGGSKAVVHFDDGLRDNGTLITNDTVAVRWTYSGIPAASSVFIDYREAGSTNEWRNLGETLASALEWTGSLANATNYEYWVYSTYIPPVPVHTNGVWVGQAYETKARVGAKSFLILNGQIWEHGRTIAPPSAKRKEDE